MWSLVLFSHSGLSLILVVVVSVPLCFSVPSSERDLPDAMYQQQFYEQIGEALYSPVSKVVGHPSPAPLQP